MAELPTPVNKPAQTVSDIINFAIYDVAVTAAETAAIAEVPFLGLPVVKQVFHFLLTKMAGLIYQPLATNAIFTVINIQTAAERVAYINAEGNLRAANLTGDPAQIKKATDEFKNAFRSLAHFDGEAHA